MKLIFRNFDVNQFFNTALGFTQQLYSNPEIFRARNQILNSMFPSPPSQQNNQNNYQQAPARRPQKQSSQLNQMNPYYRGYKIANNPYAPFIRSGQLRRY